MLKFTHSQIYFPVIITLLLGIAPGKALDDIELTGEQDGAYEKAEYIVENNIIVKRGRTLSFAPGSIIRFKRFGGLIVEGNLECKGEPSEPIVFTSMNDRPVSEREDDPQPFDWNGIDIKRSADSITLEYVRISHSTFGLKIPETLEKLSVKNCVFNDNGNADLSLGDSTVIVEDKKPFSLVTDTAPQKPDPEIDRLVSDSVVQKKQWIVPARIGFGAAALVGGGIWIGYNARAHRLH
ncbi:MAG: hypothetical protein GF401_08285, partial [Chitinivibrionales bacterium]|nr:hypothetical protein [Chitinivibrionales bacterium]